MLTRKADNGLAIATAHNWMVLPLSTVMKWHAEGSLFPVSGDELTKAGMK